MPLTLPKLITLNLYPSPPYPSPIPLTLNLTLRPQQLPVCGILHSRMNQLVHPQNLFAGIALTNTSVEMFSEIEVQMTTPDKSTSENISTEVSVSKQVLGILTLTLLTLP